MKSILYIFLSLVLFIGCNNSSNDNLKTEPFVVNSSLTRDSVYVDCYISDWLDGKDKAVAFTWDDCSYGIKDVASVFNKYNLKTTFFVNTAAISDRYLKVRFFYKQSLESILKEVEKQGHEIGSHTHNHINLSKVSLDDVDYELNHSSKEIQKYLGYYPTTLSHPESCYNPQIDSIMHLYYLDSRYTTKKDQDSLIRFMQVRTSQSFDYYKRNIDSFIGGSSNTYIFGGHQLDQVGYEPMPKEVLDSILNYIISKYGRMVWVTTFEDIVFYNIIRDKVTLTNTPGKVLVDVKEIQSILNHYTHPHAYITLVFKGYNLDFSSKGLVKSFYDGRDTYCTIDLRIDNEVSYEVIDMNYQFQRPMRNGNK